jgi:hypothetical protein
LAWRVAGAGFLERAPSQVFRTPDDRSVVGKFRQRVVAPPSPRSKSRRRRRAPLECGGELFSVRASRVEIGGIRVDHTGDEEVDLETDVCEDLEVVEHRWRDGSLLACFDNEATFVGKDEFGPTLEDVEDPPATRCDLMAREEGTRGVLFVKGTCRSGSVKASGELSPGAQRTFEARANPCAAGRVVEDPGTILEGRTVTYVLGVKTGELGNPLSLVIEVEGDDPTSHRRFCARHRAALESWRLPRDAWLDVARGRPVAEPPSCTNRCMAELTGTERFPPS